MNIAEQNAMIIDPTQDADEKQQVPIETDPNIVDWDGPNDPEKALNWPDKKKWANVAIVSVVTLLTPWHHRWLHPQLRSS